MKNMEQLFFDFDFDFVFALRAFWRSGDCCGVEGVFCRDRVFSEIEAHPLEVRVIDVNGWVDRVFDRCGN